MEWREGERTSERVDLFLDEEEGIGGRKGRVIKWSGSETWFGGIGRLVHTGRGLMFSYFVEGRFDSEVEAKKWVEKCFELYDRDTVFYWRRHMRLNFLTQFLEADEVIDLRELAMNYQWSLLKLIDYGEKRGLRNEIRYARERLSQTLGKESVRAYWRKVRKRQRGEDA